MAAPAPATDSKKAPLIDSTPVAPPSYSDATNAATYGDGNVFTDAPRGATMDYSEARREEYQPRERKGWSVGFFDCFSDPRAAVKAYLCPCVSYAQTRHRLHSPNTPAPLISTPCLGYCFTGTCFPGAEFIFGFLQRGEIRNRLEIGHVPNSISLGAAGRTREVKASVFENWDNAKGFVDDVARHMFCSCCALTQEDREVRAWEARERMEGLGEWDEEEGRAAVVIGEEGIREEGERLLGGERQGLQGLRG
ncbi:hypothetical protein RUND412_001076 [Rhizina undulata]